MTVKEFYEVSGSNYEEAIGRMTNDAFILRFLLKFINSDYGNNLINAYNNKNMHEVFEVSHAIKGVAGNLALTRLFELSSSITEKTRNLPEGELVNLDSEVTSFKEEFEKVVNQIKQIEN